MLTQHRGPPSPSAGSRGDPRRESGQDPDAAGWEVSLGGRQGHLRGQRRDPPLPARPPARSPSRLPTRAGARPSTAQGPSVSSRNGAGTRVGVTAKR